MSKVKKQIIKILIFTVFILFMTLNVEAAGIEGTTIVLNPRTWRD